jgi:hypothetical protein
VVDWLSIQSGCANCSRNDCKCKNRKIKIPQDFIQFKNKVLLSQRDVEESSDKSESKDDNSESEEKEEDFNEYYFHLLTQVHQHVSDSDNDSSEASSDLEGPIGAYMFNYDDNDDSDSSSDDSDSSSDDSNSSSDDSDSISDDSDSSSDDSDSHNHSNEIDNINDSNSA